MERWVPGEGEHFFRSRRTQLPRRTAWDLGRAMPPVAKQRRNRERATELITVLDGMVNSSPPPPFPGLLALSSTPPTSVSSAHLEDTAGTPRSTASSPREPPGHEGPHPKECDPSPWVLVGHCSALARLASAGPRAANGDAVRACACVRHSFRTSLAHARALSPSVQVPAKYPYRAFSKPAVGAELSLQKRSRNMTLEDVIDAVSGDGKPPRRTAQRRLQDCCSKTGPIVARRRSDSRVSERGERDVCRMRGVRAARLRCMRKPGHALHMTGPARPGEGEGWTYTASSGRQQSRSECGLSR